MELHKEERAKIPLLIYFSQTTCALAEHINDIATYHRHRTGKGCSGLSLNEALSENRRYRHQGWDSMYPFVIIWYSSLLFNCAVFYKEIIRLNFTIFPLTFVSAQRLLLVDHGTFDCFGTRHSKLSL
jgi:hypothetical protein